MTDHERDAYGPSEIVWLSRKVDTMVFRALAKRPEERFATAAQWLTVLASARGKRERR